MKINDDALSQLSQSNASHFDKEGKLFVYIPVNSKNEEKEKNYNECFCRLQSNLLFLFDDANETRLIILNDINISSCNESEFQLTNNHSNHARMERFYFVADLEQTCQEWIDAIYFSTVHLRKMFKASYKSKAEDDQDEEETTLGTIREEANKNCYLHISCEYSSLGVSSLIPRTYVKAYIRNLYIDQHWTCLGQTEVVRSNDPIFSRCLLLPSRSLSDLGWFEFKFQVHLIVQLETDCSVIASQVYARLDHRGRHKQLALKSLRNGNSIGSLCLSLIAPSRVKRSGSLSKIDSNHGGKKLGGLYRMHSQPHLSMSPSDQSPSNQFLLDQVNLQLFTKPIYRKFVFKTFYPASIELNIEEVISESRSTLFIPQIIMKLLNEGEASLVSALEKFAEANQTIDGTCLESIMRLHSSLSSQLQQAQSQLIDYLESWSFRPSKHKTEAFLQTVPLNLHKQTYRIKAVGREKMASVFCVGAYTCHQLGFNGENMLCLIRDNSRVIDAWILSKRMLRVVKCKQIIFKQLQAINDFLQNNIADSMAKITEMYGTVSSFAEKLDRILTAEQVERLCFRATQKQFVSEELEPIELLFLNIKACLVLISDRIERKLWRFEDYDSCNRKLKVAIDSLEKIVLTCYLSLQADLAGKERQLLARLRWRNLCVISQALCSLIIFLMDRLARDGGDNYLEHLYRTKVVLVQQTSLLDCIDNEGDMLADTVYAINEINNSLNIVFRFDANHGHASLPEIIFFGDKIELTFHLEKGHSLANVNSFNCRLLYLIFNVAIATPASRVQSPWPNFQEDLNQTNFDKLKAYINSTEQACPLAKDNNTLLLELETNVFRSRNHSDNVAILRLVELIAEKLGAIRVTNCKSAKDRTGMSVTLEVARAALRLVGIKNEEEDNLLLQTILDTLRRDGVRLEVCYKNIGKKKYAFSSVAHLPGVYRPPACTNQSGDIET